LSDGATLLPHVDALAASVAAAAGGIHSKWGMSM
jgi:hypothetical protein